MLKRARDGLRDWIETGLILIGLVVLFALLVVMKIGEGADPDPRRFPPEF